VRLFVTKLLHFCYKFVTILRFFGFVTKLRLFCYNFVTFLQQDRHLSIILKTFMRK